MAQCAYCKYFKYDCRISIKNKVDNEVSLGYCTRDNTDRCDMTLGNRKACNYYAYNEPVYKVGDVLSGKDNVIAIKAIQHEYAPNIYRVRTNFGSEWSASAERLKELGYKLVWSKDIVRC